MDARNCLFSAAGFSGFSMLVISFIFLGKTGDLQVTSDSEAA